MGYNSGPAYPYYLLKLQLLWNGLEALHGLRRDHQGIHIMAGMRQKTLEVRARYHQCGRVDQRMKLKGFLRPQRFIHNQFNLFILKTM